ARISFMPGGHQSECMQSVAKLRLFASPDARRMLFTTMERYNAACNAASPVAFSERQFSNIGLQKQLYYQVRETFGLSAQMAQLAIRKVAGSYRSTNEAIKERNNVLAALGQPQKTLTEISFRTHGAICYDARVLSLGRNRVSIWTLDGRIKLRYSKPDHFPAVATVKQTDLVYRDGAFWLYATVETPDVEPAEPTGYLGVDLGVVKIATTSDGAVATSDATEKVRQRYGSLRARLQACGTKDAKEKLRKISGRERRFKTDTNARATSQVGVPPAPILHRVQGPKGRGWGEGDRRGVYEPAVQCLRFCSPGQPPEPDSVPLPRVRSRRERRSERSKEHRCQGSRQRAYCGLLP
ncbi:MAG: Transposase, IS605 OrfB family, partial [Methanoculleus marisnigri]